MLALTHVYSAYPAVKEAKARIAKGELGKLRRVYVEYTQGWLSERIELLGGNNAGWRTDPKRSGKAGCIGDIGTHAWHLSEYITGLKVKELCADLKAFVPGRPIDDDGAAFLRYENDEKGGLEWRQMEPNTLTLRWRDRQTEILDIGNNGYLTPEALWNTRTPAGHPEGFIEAFANIYRNFSLTVRAIKNGETPSGDCLDFPTVYDGVRGMQFIETMVEAG